MGHQQSSVDRLPDDLREQLQELLRDPRVTQLDATRQLNEILERECHPERLTKSAVNRYAKKMEKVGEKIQQSREVAKMWIGRLGAEPQGEVGKLITEVLRNLIFETTQNLLEQDADVDPKAIKDLAVAVERLERATSENVKRDEEVRKRERERLAGEFDKAAENAKQTGVVAPETLKAIREQVYGLV